ncbi:MAG TPA: hypothetical protein VHX15_02885 [Frankiaceae bacterium]|jgi:hypothetical protein|nr:hypothetical protein [Frankiaceae bacterium]
MIAPEQARMACELVQRQAQAQTDHSRLVAAARLQRRAARRAARAERASRAAAHAAAQATLAWAQLS